ncbi:copper transporter 1-like [Neltuma alba]|uniref:copper transporter 1-like n=1 Tax=Neltuma alba TaxID=207710 RepID=UPI0010A392C9|nr:copper transporter 1-like [Prosopis alba]
MDHMHRSMKRTKKMNMHMVSFYWGKDATALFSGWPNHSLGMYILAIFLTFLLALLCELFSKNPTLEPGTSHLLGGLSHSVFYFFHIGFHYLVMLAVMSFNLGIFIAAMVGHTHGFLILKYRAIHCTNKDPGV